MNWVALGIVAGVIVGLACIVIAVSGKYTPRRAVLYWTGFALLILPTFCVKAYFLATRGWQ